MEENPYQPSSVEQKYQESVNPAWIYGYTAASSLVGAGVPLVTGYIIIRFYEPFQPDFLLVGAGTLSVAVLFGTIFGWRVWRRLSRVHVLQQSVLAKRTAMAKTYIEQADFEKRETS